MSNPSREATKKKTPQTFTSSPSPKKMKIQDADLPKTLVEASVSGSAKPILDIAKDDSKSRALSQRVDKTAELKSKIVLLKKKPGDFDPELVSCWENGDNVPFMFLCLAFDLISVESSRIMITDILYIMLRTIIATSPQDLLPTVYLGKSLIIKAISEAFGSTVAQVEQQNKTWRLGGDLAIESRSSQTLFSKPQPLLRKNCLVEKGISLREDKKPEEATSSKQIAEMFRAQKHNHLSNQAESDDD